MLINPDSYRNIRYRGEFPFPPSVGYDVILIRIPFLAAAAARNAGTKTKNNLPLFQSLPNLHYTTTSKNCSQDNIIHVKRPSRASTISAAAGNKLT